eukprot:CAMPEP_0185731756 /NCGR_PEP_ID=MMETSP1171-20130828/13908_1 /TAXON_ID=374046 /ORGANISM="Helicotheca tamensis, Strain CCMP826" /LENGTH=161 /DNA_ID=CAMNT_0028401081 /DNA_START=151 /DNA_END=636 /DNA_ORIENTATION=-
MALATLFAIQYASFTEAAFGMTNLRSSRPATSLFLEDDIAKMIDQELVRLANKDQIEDAWQRKNAEYLETSLPQEVEFDDDMLVSAVLPKQVARDKKMVEDDPRRYCADRCVATGNCEIFEDMFDLSPTEVLKFCKDCVMADDENKECDVDWNNDSNKLHP